MTARMHFPQKGAKGCVWARWPRWLFAQRQQAFNLPSAFCILFPGRRNKRLPYRPWSCGHTSITSFQSWDCRAILLFLVKNSFLLNIILGSLANIHRLSMKLCWLSCALARVTCSDPSACESCVTRVAMWRPNLQELSLRGSLEKEGLWRTGGP